MKNVNSRMVSCKYGFEIEGDFMINLPEVRGRMQRESRHLRSSDLKDSQQYYW